MSTEADDKATAGEAPANDEPAARTSAAETSAAETSAAETSAAEPAAQEPAAQEAKAPRARTAAKPAAAKEKAADEQADEAAVTDEAADEPAAKAKPVDEPAAKAPRARAAAKPATAKSTAAKEPADSEAAAKGPAAKGPAAKRSASKAKAIADGGHPAAMADLPADIFDAKVNIALMHQVVVAQQAAARQGTHSTKTRGNVRGGGKKPYRQKGTGRARQGSTRAPQFAGGGVVHGPVPRSYAQKTPKKMKAAALRGALSDRARHGLVYVVDSFVDGETPKTQEALAALNVATGTVPATSSMLVVVQSSDKITWKSLRNAPGVHLIDPGQLNTYDVLVSDRVVFTSTALASFVARAGRPGSAEGEEQ
jgi:large subunit ribosomal protein L4